MKNICPCCHQTVETKREVFVCLDTNTLSFRGRTIKLTAKSAELAFILAERAPMLSTYEHIRSRLWPINADTADSNVMFVHICHLRTRLAGTGLRVETTWGKGVQFEMEPVEMLQAAE